jgi:hypothetical protein
MLMRLGVKLMSYRIMFELIKGEMSYVQDLETVQLVRDGTFLVNLSIITLG